MDWEGGTGGEAGERSARLQNYCELLGILVNAGNLVRVSTSVGCLGSLNKVSDVGKRQKSAFLM